MHTKTFGRMVQVRRVLVSAHQTGSLETERRLIGLRRTRSVRSAGFPPKISRRARPPESLGNRDREKSTPWPLHLAAWKEAPSAPSIVYIGIDPDVSGALGVLNIARSRSGIELADIRVVDTPCEVQVVNRKRRRRLHAESVLEVVRELMSSIGDSPVVACLETPAAAPTNGSVSNRLSGYGYGVWHGVLLAHGIPVKVVHPGRWKRQLNLFGTGKEGSLALANDLFPSAGSLLRRKKDHGRAEALLLAAWRSGLRLLEESRCQSYEEAMTRMALKDEDEEQMEKAPIE